MSSRRLDARKRSRWDTIPSENTQHGITARIYTSHLSVSCIRGFRIQMEDSECIVCFSKYDDKKHRPRVMPCGHTECSNCLKRAIREQSKTCPKCRQIYSASNVLELPINFSLEGMVKSLNSSDKLPDCAEHQFTVSHRCSTHKAWICQSCLEEDHSSELCQIMTISEKIDINKSKQLDKSQPFLIKFEKTCNESDDSKKQCKRLMEENDEEIIRYEAVAKRLKEEIKKKKASKKEMEENYTIFDQNIEFLKGKRSLYDKAVTSLKTTETIKGVSNCAVEVQNEAEKLESISHDIKTGVDLMLQTFKISTKSSTDYTMANCKVSVRNGMYHLHCIQGESTPNSTPYNLQLTDEIDPALTDGILTFMDIAWPGQEPRRVYMKMFGNTARARQHILLVTTECGHSYKDLKFYCPDREGQPGDYLIIQPYTANQAAPLLKDVTITDVVVLEQKIGLMGGAGMYGNVNNACFGIYLRDDPGMCIDSGFGQVTSGIEILQDVAKSDEKEKIKVVDCGVVLFW